MRRGLILALAVWLLATPAKTPTQTADDAGAKNAAQAHEALDRMVQALGGQAWLTMKNSERQGHIAAFFQGKPSGGTTEFWEFHQAPDHDRYEYTKHRDVVGFFIGREGWEVTYRGKHPLPQEQVDDFLRRRELQGSRGRDGACARLARGARPARAGPQAVALHQGIRTVRARHRQADRLARILEARGLGGRDCSGHGAGVPRGIDR